jgi:hypothetical protein
VGKKRGTSRVLVSNLNKRDNLEDQDIDGRKIFKYILKIYDGRPWTGLIGPRKWTRSGLFLGWVIKFWAWQKGVGDFLTR